MYFSDEYSSRNVEDELTKKAVDMLLKGATLLGEPCPYCSGVRVMKEGHALCISCGREPKKEPESAVISKKPSDPIEILEKKLDTLSRELENEIDHEKQQNILKSINSLIETIDKLKKKQ